MPSLEQFVSTCEPIVRKLAHELLGRYSGWFKDPDGELDDLIQAGLLRVVIIYPKIDFENKGYKGFVYQSIKGVLLNYITKNIPRTLSDDQFIKTVSLESSSDFLKDDIEHLNDGADIDIDVMIFRSRVFELTKEYMETISPIDQFILVSRFVDKKNYENIGDVIGWKRKRVSKNATKLIDDLRKYFASQRGWFITIDDMEEYLNHADLDTLRAN